jgi:predicted nucleotidyltransferase
LNGQFLSAWPIQAFNDMMKKSIARTIKDRLLGIEKNEDVTILYACESGSRAWGFESIDSDYDVRFIYLRRTPQYLAVNRGRDVIERPIDNDIDLSGWDLIKVLELFRKSNPPLLEWIQSPIVYLSRSSLMKRLRHLLPQFYSPRACMYHYLHMADGNFRMYLKGDEVWTKKYFYVLRPVLACLWIERGLGVVPIEFQKLVDAVVTDKQLLNAVDSLLAAKKAGQELRKGPRNVIISSFAEKQITRLNGAEQRIAELSDPAALNSLFVNVLIEVNGMSIEPGAPNTRR